MSRERLVQAIKTVNAKHVYTVDRKDSWSPNPLGDCEDYMLAVIKEYAGGRRFAFYKTLLFGPFKFWYGRIGREGHMIAQFGHEYFDNNFRQLVPKSEMQRIGFTFDKKYSGFKVWSKTIIT